MKVKEKVYVTHTCRNSKLSPKDPNYCDRAFIDTLNSFKYVALEFVTLTIASD